MAFWSKFFGTDPPTDPNYRAGDPNGVEIAGDDFIGERSLPLVLPSPWSGWPGEWAPPAWSSPQDVNRLVDVAWAAIDLNASVLASMPMYRLQSGAIIDDLPWMRNPDPTIYTSWYEFAKQLFWDYQAVGEAFVLPMSHYSNGYPQNFRVVPPWLINVEMDTGTRRYRLGAVDVTDEILHIRYHSRTDDGHGHSPLEVAGARLTASQLLTRYAHKLAETGGTPHYWMDVQRHLNKEQADELLDQWVESRKRRAGEPALLTGGAKLNQLQSMNARDMALLELQQFNEARVAILLGVPPFLLGLPMAQGESLTYSNAATLFDYHDRSSLRTKAAAVMPALSWWALPQGQSVELNRDEYSRPGYLERAQANQIYLQTGVLTVPDVQAMERFHGDAAAASLTGVTAPQPPPPPTPPVSAPPAPAGGFTVRQPN